MTAPVKLVTKAFISADPTNNVGGVYLDNGAIVSDGTGNLTSTKNIKAGTLTSTGAVAVTGNITAGTLTSTGAIAATGNVTAGTLTSTGSIAATGNITSATMSSTLQAGGIDTTAVTLTKTETLTPDARVMRSVCSTSTASAITMATAGMLDGQELTIIHLGPSTITLSGNVAPAITTVVTGAYAFTYDATTTKWYHKA